MIDFEDLKGTLPMPVDNYQSFENCCVDQYNQNPTKSLADPIENQLHIICDSNATAFSWASGLVDKTFKSNGHWVVIVSHGNFLTVYINLDKLQVEVGDQIGSLQPLGTVAKINEKYQLEIELWEKGSKEKRTTGEKLDPIEWLEKK